ncbi:MAG: competence/damage-inducible protein A [Gemmatimonadales bacterium]
MDCEILTVGTELVLGFTVNTNAAEMGRALAEAGVHVIACSTVGDHAGGVKEMLRVALERSGTVIVSGGLGPTSDDLTRPAVAELFGRKLVRDPALVEQMRGMFRSRGAQNMPEANLVQADVPEGATVLPNPRGTAPGLWIEDGARLVVLIPGVPKEMRGLLAEEVIPRLLRRTGGQADGRTVVRSRTLRTTGIGESALADRLGDVASALGEKVTLAYLPSAFGTDLRLTVWNAPEQGAEDRLERAAAALRPRLGDRMYGEGETDLAAVVLKLLEERQASLATAESCTGGLVGARLTAIPGSSRVYRGGIVAYDDEVKLQQLGVSADDVATHGAVSEAVVRQMAEGVARSLDADAAVAITGIAGPSGGSDAKPVGTVWIAVRWQDQVRAFTHILPGDREDVRARAAQYALDYLRRRIQGTLG